MQEGAIITINPSGVKEIRRRGEQARIEIANLFGFSSDEEGFEDLLRELMKVGEGIKKRVEI